MYNPDFVAAGGARGFGQYTTQAENGGRFFSTTAFVFDGMEGPFPELARDYQRIVENLLEIGATLSSENYSTPLLPRDRGFLSTPTSLDSSGIVNYLCAKVRAQFHFPNVTDAWGERLCAYYEDLPLGLPENGVALWSAAKAFLGLKVGVNGTLTVGVVGGEPVVVKAGMHPWRASGTLTEAWPVGVKSVVIRGVAVGSAPPVMVSCSVAATLANTINCTLALM